TPIDAAARGYLDGTRRPSVIRIRIRARRALAEVSVKPESAGWRDLAEDRVAREQTPGEVERALRHVRVRSRHGQALRGEPRAELSDTKPVRQIGATEGQIREELFELGSAPSREC